MKDQLIFDYVILVDDDTIINHVHELLINKQHITKKIKSYLNPLEAVTAIQALLLQDHLKILVLLDLNMPEMTGFEFLDKIGQLENKAQLLEVLIVSSSIDAQDISKSNRHPLVRQYIPKPLNSKIIAGIMKGYSHLATQS
ncbi:MAG: response regulator [Arenibacter sp.]|nr:response regulator [Arenibacter sp.]